METTVKQRLSEFITSLNIAPSRFEKECGLSNGYLRQLRKEPSRDKIESIIAKFPQLSVEWLLNGEGEMLRAGYTQNVTESENFTQTGNVTVHGDSAALLKVLDELSAQRKLTEKAQEQIDRLISIIEKH
jgi:hypothetical protein